MTPKQKALLDYVARRLKAQGYAPSQAEIARHFGFRSLGTVQNYLRALRREGLLSQDWNARRGLRPGPRREAPEGLVRLPLLGLVAAGRPIEALEGDEEVELPSWMTARSGRHYALRVTGDSMREQAILDKDLVVVRHQAQAENGRVVVALVDGEATIKIWMRVPGAVELRPANPRYRPIVVRDGEARRLELRGVVTGVLRALK